MSELGDPLEPEHAYWLFKKDPEDFDVGRLRLSSGKEVLWTGTRGAEDTQQIKLIRREDVILLFSTGDVPAITGILEATGDPIPDCTSYDADFSGRYWVTPPDRLMPGCSIGNNPFWAVRVKLVNTFAQPVPMKEIVLHEAWQGMDLGDFTVMPLSEEQWDIVIDLAQRADDPKQAV